VTATETNYVDRVVDLLNEELTRHGHSPLPGEMGRLYALLVLTKGAATTLEDVHDAWSLATTVDRPEHRSLIAFDDLSVEVQTLDAPFVWAIHAVRRVLDGDRRVKVAIIGSLFHPGLLHAVAAAETRAGRDVIAIPRFAADTDEPAAVEAYKPYLATADEIVVVPRPDGTLGRWSLLEVSYAATLGKPVRFVDPVPVEVGS